MKCIVLLLLAAISACVHAQTVQQAICYMYPTLSSGLTSITGTVTFNYTAPAVTSITVSVSGLPASKSLGFHVHQFGYIGTFEGNGAGGHFNPFNASHAYPYNQPRHVGDMGNITTDASGTASLTTWSELIRFDGPASIIGRSVIIHAAPDDGVSQPTGNAGARIAQCVVGIQAVPANTVNAAIADQTNYNYGVAELMTTPSTFGNTRVLKGRALFEQQTSSTLLSVRICGFAPGSVHSIALAPFGDRASVGNTTTVFGTVTADSQGIIDANLTTNVAVNGSSSVVGQSFVVFEGTATTDPSTISLVGVIGAINVNPGLPPCGVEWGACYLKSTAVPPNPVNGTIIIKHIMNDPTGVWVQGTVTGLAPNTTHGWHIHQYGHVGTPDASGTGGHFNPFNHNHSLPNNTRHIGDFGNLVSDVNGVATIAAFFSSEINMGFSGPSSIIGKAIVVHQLADDGQGATGNAGTRYSQCVIGIANPGSNPLLANAAMSDNVGTAPGTYFGTCELYAINSNVTGRVIFSESSVGQMRVQAKICGVDPNSDHGFHVHQYGDLTGAALNTNIASHYNPAAVAHGYPDSSVHHLGDMGNATADANGIINFDKTFSGMSMTGMFSIMGRAVVLHINRDDGGQPTGNAGNPMATCVIGFVPTVNLNDVLCNGETTMAPTPTPSSGPTSTAAPSTSTPTPTPTKSGAAMMTCNALLMVCLVVLTMFML